MTQSTPKLKIAVSQFPVESDIKSNLQYISRHIDKAGEKGVDVVHFPEMSLSGYDTPVNEINWDLLDDSIKKLQNIVEENKVFLVIGIHVINQKNKKPFNATLLISDRGTIVGKYLKTKLYEAEQAPRAGPHAPAGRTRPRPWGS